MVQDIKAVKTGCAKCTQKKLCHRVELSGTLLVLQKTKSVVSIGCR